MRIVCPRHASRLGATLARLFLVSAITGAVACKSPATSKLVTTTRWLRSDVVGAGIELDGVVVRSTKPFELKEVSIHGDRRPSLTVASPASLRFRLADEAASTLSYGLAVRPADTVATLRWLDGQGRLIHEESWGQERGFVDRRHDLVPNSGAELVLELEGPPAEIILAHPQAAAAKTASRLDRPPNVIVYLVDCLRADALGSHGYDRPTSPNLDHLATQGVALENLVSCAPWTKPSTGCLFTSLGPTFHQARTVDDALGQERRTIAELFRGAGFATAAFVANPVIDPRVFFFNQGFDRWQDLRSFQERSQRAHINGLVTDSADITRAVQPWLRSHRDRRFFLYLHSLDLHYEYRRRAPFDEMLVSETSSGLERDRELYDNELAYNDGEIGKLIALLEELNLYDDTLLLVTSDHGEEFGEHGLTRHGKTLYDDVLHIPAIFKLPGGDNASRRIDQLATNLDLAPTLLDFANISVPEEFQGVSLRPLMTSDAPTPHRRVFAELTAPKFVSYSVQDRRYKLIRQLVPDNRQMLFDLVADREETNNLAHDPPLGGTRLFAELDRVVQLAQNGYHLSVLGQKPGRRVRIRVRAPEGEIVAAMRFSIVTGDELVHSPDGRGLSMEFTSDGEPRHLVVQTRPEGVPIEVRLHEDGIELSRARIGVGTASDTEHGLPIVFRASDTEVSMEEATSLIQSEASQAMARVWFVPLLAGRNPVPLDAETERNLRALGYIQ